MYPALTSYTEKIESGISEISSDRKEKLENISAYIADKQAAGKHADIIFICTHNSRRSHLCQIWAATAAQKENIAGASFYSGGTEVTAFNSRAAAALKRAGFKVTDPGGENPRYEVFWRDQESPIICFSKTFDDPYNPQKNFVAVMTCSDADENCPFIPGAELRVSIPYDDPKKADGTRNETRIYNQRCRQIAAEMFYMISRVNT